MNTDLYLGCQPNWICLEVGKWDMSKPMIQDINKNPNQYTRCMLWREIGILGMWAFYHCIANYHQLGGWKHIHYVTVSMSPESGTAGLWQDWGQGVGQGVWAVPMPMAAEPAGKIHSLRLRILGSFLLIPRWSLRTQDGVFHPNVTQPQGRPPSPWPSSVGEP